MDLARRPGRARRTFEKCPGEIVIADSAVLSADVPPPPPLAVDIELNLYKRSLFTASSKTLVSAAPLGGNRDCANRDSGNMKVP